MATIGSNYILNSVWNGGIQNVSSEIYAIPIESKVRAFASSLVVCYSPVFSLPLHIRLY